MLAQNSAHNSQTVTKNVLSLTKTQLVSLDRAIDNCHVWRTHTQIDFRKREWGKKTNPPSMILFLWKLFEIYFWLCVMLRGYFEDETLLVLSFPFPSSPARFFFPPLPSFPTKQRGLCGEESEVGLFFRRRFNRYLARVASFSLDYRQSFITLLIVAVSDKTELIFYLPLTLCCTEKRSSLNHVFLAREKWRQTLWWSLDPPHSRKPCTKRGKITYMSTG